MTSIQPTLRMGLGALAAACVLTLGASARQTLGCTTGGAGGPIPTSGTGGGAPLPTFPMISTLNVVSLPPGATVVTEVKLLGLTHTYTGDVQWVLTDPSGVAHNVFNRPGGSCDYNGDYAIVGQCTSGVAFSSCTGFITPGVYHQFFGAWADGNQGIFNTPLNTISAATGTWTLTAYDWLGGDIGALTSWDLCFGVPATPSAPTVAPVLTAPADSALVTLPVTLTWNTAACATSYDVDVDGLVTTGVAGTSFLVPAAAPGAHTWAVRGRNVAGVGPWSALRTFIIPTPPPPSNCVATGGTGGAIPTTGTGGGGVFPGTFPPSEMIGTLNFTPPPGATQFVKIQLNGLSHTFLGDLQFVLYDPSGVGHNLLCRQGGGCDMAGDYSLYAASGSGWASCAPSSFFAPGDYAQNFGTWPSGTNGVFNTSINSIPLIPGVYTLKIYDWAGADVGALTSWDLCVNTLTGPTTFCTPLPSGTTHGCVPTITASGQPDPTHSAPCVITVSNVEGQKLGLIFYGISGQVNFPWCTGGSSFLCVKAPTQRMPSMNSGGTLAQCDGQIVQDYNAFQLANPLALGNPWSSGATVDLQGWFRDPPACKTTALSEGVRLTYQ